jgi:hypothetical protein
VTSMYVCKDALRPGGVMICAGRLAGAGCEKPKIKRDGEQLDCGGLMMMMINTVTVH